MNISILYFYKNLHLPLSIITLYLFLNILSVYISRPLLGNISSNNSFIGNISQEYIRNNANQVFITTNDGYIHAFEGKEEKWKFDLGGKLMTLNLLNSKSLNNNKLILFPIDEKLYIFDKVNFKVLPLKIFVSDLVKEKPMYVNNFLLYGEMKTTIYNIDIETGELIKEIDGKDNKALVKKTSNQTMKMNSLTVFKIEYILNCLGEEDVKLWKAFYTDIIIERGKENSQQFIINEPFKFVDDFIGHKNFQYESIMNIYCSFNNRINPVKIYDKSNDNLEIERRAIGENSYWVSALNRNYLDGKIQQSPILHKLNDNEGKMEWKDWKEISNYLKYILKSIDKSRENKDIYIMILWNYILRIIEEYKIIINLLKFIIIMSFIVIIKILLKYKKKLNLKENTIKELIKNKENIKLINQDKTNNNNNNIENSIINTKQKESSDKNENIINNNQNNNNIDVDIIKECSNNDDIPNSTQLIKRTKDSSNFNNFPKTQNPLNSLFSQTKNFPYPKFSTTSLKVKEKTHSFVFSITQKYKFSKTEEVREAYDKIKSCSVGRKKGVKNSEGDFIEKVSNKNKKDNIDICTEEICNNIDNISEFSDNEESSSEEEEHESIYKMYNKSKKKENKKENNKIHKSNIKTNNNTKTHMSDTKNNKINNIIKSNEKEKLSDSLIFSNQSSDSLFMSRQISKTSQITEKSELNKNKNESLISNKYKTPKKSKQIQPSQPTRFEMDFRFLGNLGKGGFGFVIKARHRLDRGVYAIKIIDLSALSDVRDMREAVREVQKMMLSKSNFVVQYFTCWLQFSLGNLEGKVEFERDEEEEEEESDYNSNLSSLSKSFKNEYPKTRARMQKLKAIKDSDIIIEKDESDLNSNYSDDDNIKVSIKKTPKYSMIYRDDSQLYSSKKSVSSFTMEKEALKFPQRYLFIQMEFCSGLSLDQFISKAASENRKIDKKLIHKFTIQLLDGLKTIHNSGIIHRDIKPDNIFVVEGNAKIGDFGLSTSKRKISSKEDVAGSPLYLSPEQKKGECYNEKVDIFALGLTLLELLACFPTMMEKVSGFQNLNKEQKIDENIIKDYSEEVKVVLWLTDPKFSQRPSAEEALKSDTIKRWKEEEEKNIEIYIHFFDSLKEKQNIEENEDNFEYI